MDILMDLSKELLEKIGNNRVLTNPLFKAPRTKMTMKSLSRVLLEEAELKDVRMSLTLTPNFPRKEVFVSVDLNILTEETQHPIKYLIGNMLIGLNLDKSVAVTRMTLSKILIDKINGVVYDKASITQKFRARIKTETPSFKTLLSILDVLRVPTIIITLYAGAHQVEYRIEYSDRLTFIP